MSQQGIGKKAVYQAECWGAGWAQSDTTYYPTNPSPVTAQAMHDIQWVKHPLTKHNPNLLMVT